MGLADKLRALFATGTGFDTNVARDELTAQEHKTAREVDEILCKGLDVMERYRPDTSPLKVSGKTAPAVVEQLWATPSANALDQNALGCALAWLRHWDAAIVAFKASGELGSKHWAANVNVVNDARRKAAEP